MSFAQLDKNYAAAVQKELRAKVANLRELNDNTLKSFSVGNGTRKKQGRLAGLQVPYFKNSPHGSTAYSPTVGDTSFNGYVAPTTGAMYVGLAFLALTVQLEMHHLKDMKRGFIPESLYEKRDHAISMHMKKKNWYSIGNGDGGFAYISSATAGGLITCTNDNTAIGRSKGSTRLAVSPSTAAGDQIKYDVYNTTTDTRVARIYITSKPNATQAQAAIADGIGTLGALNVAGLVIVEQGHYKKVPRGLGYHISAASRLYQGADTTADPFLNSLNVAAGGAITPTIINNAKAALDTRANSGDASKKKCAHLSFGNYEVLANYGYTLREYNAEKGQAQTTYGLPRVYEDEDTMFFRDADFEDGFIYLREKEPYFEYNQMEFGNVDIDGQTIRQYVGTNLVGSSEGYQNYAEACNFAWDARGKDGTNKAGKGAPNSSVQISGITIPANNQVAQWAGF